MEEESHGEEKEEELEIENLKQLRVYALATDSVPRAQSWCVGPALILRVGNRRADFRPAPLPAKLVTFVSVSA